MILLQILFLIWIAFGVIGAQLGKPKGKLLLGALLGFLLGPVGLVIIVLIRKKCPQCASWVKWQAKICKHCQTALPTGDEYLQSKAEQSQVSTANITAKPEPKSDALVDKLYRKISGDPEPPGVVDPNDPVEKWKRTHPPRPATR